MNAPVFADRRRGSKRRRGKPFSSKRVLGKLGGPVAPRSTRSSFVFVRGSTVIEGKRPGRNARKSMRVKPYHGGTGKHPGAPKKSAKRRAAGKKAAKNRARKANGQFKKKR